MNKRKLTHNEDRVLLCLYERRDSGKETPFDEIVAGTGLSSKEVRSAIRGLTDAGMIGGDGPDLLRDATNALKGMQPDLLPTARGYAENVILVASVLSKADEGFLAEELSYDEEFVAFVGSRLRTAGIWKDDAVSERHTDGWGKDPVAYFLDCAVAVGDLMIVGENTDGEFLFQMTPGGKGHVENLLGRQR